MATTRRRGVKDTKPEVRQRLNVRVLEETYERLLVHCIKAKMQPGAFLDMLIADNCKEWRVQANGSHSVANTDRREIAGGVSAPVANVA